MKRDRGPSASWPWAPLQGPGPLGTNRREGGDPMGRVWMAEDDCQVADIVARYLQRDGFETRLFFLGGETLEALGGDVPDRR